MTEPLTFEDFWTKVAQTIDKDRPEYNNTKELSRLIWNEALTNAQTVVLDLPTPSDNIEASVIKIRVTSKLALLKSE